MSVATFLDDWIIGTDEGFVIKRDGMNIATDDPGKATGYADRQDAINARPGHDRAMGGSGQRGGTVRRGVALLYYQRWKDREYNRW